MTSRRFVPQMASTMIAGRLHLHERHVHYNTPGHSAAIRSKGKTPAGQRNDSGMIAAGWIDVETFRGQEVWITRAAAARILNRQPQWIDRLTEARLVNHTMDGTGELWLKIDPTWTPEHFETIFNSRPFRPATLADFEAYEIGRGLFGYGSEKPHPEHILDAVVDLLSEVGVFGLDEVRGVIILPVDYEPLMQDLWTRYLKRSRSWPASRTALDLDTFRLLLPPAIANASGTCFDEDEPDDRPAPPPQILSRLARLKRIRNEASLFLLLAAGRGTNLQYLTAAMSALRIVDDMLDERDGDPRDQATMDAVLRDLAFGDDPNLTRERRHDHARNVMTMILQLSAVTERSPKDEARDLRPYRLAGPKDATAFRRRLNSVGDNIRAEGRARRKASSDALSDAFGHVLAVARRRCDQVADLTDDALVEAAALNDASEDFIDVETTSWILNDDGTYGDGLQVIHLRVWKADRLWIRLHDKGLLTHEPHARNRVRDGLKTGEHYEKGKRYYQYRGSTPIDGATPQTPWFATLFIDAAMIRPGLLPLTLREKRAELIKRWQLPGSRPMKGGLLSFSESSHMYRMAAMDDIVLIPLEEFDHAMRAAHLAFRAGMIVGSRINETIQMAYRSADWPVLQIGSVARTGWLAVPKQTNDKGRIGEMRKPRFFMADDITFRYFTEMAKTVVRRSHPGGVIPSMPPAATLRWKTGDKPYAFSLDGQALSASYLNTCLRYLLANVAVCTLHDTRHASANRGWVEGEELQDTMLRLGHSSERSSLHYRSPTAPQAELAAARALDRRTRDESLRYWESLFD